jgi:hypothetical protein
MNLTPNFQPLHDMILVKEDPAPERIGSIFIPEGSFTPGHKPGRSDECFTGTVVAVGPGDRHKPFESLTCRACRSPRFFDAETDSYLCECPKAEISREIAAKWDAGHYPMLTKIGDRVVYPRRASMPGGEFSVTLFGESYVMFHEEQSAFAVIEG